MSTWIRLRPEVTLDSAGATANQLYQLSELRIAINDSDLRRLLPPLPPQANHVLDLGCGAGQTLLALGMSHPTQPFTAVGVEVDDEALLLGTRLLEGIHFVQASGERLPFAPASFDFIYSRVALPYMHIPMAIAECSRLLRPGGRIWFSLHPPAFSGWKYLIRSPRRIVFELYRLANTLAFHYLGVCFPLHTHRFESFQTEQGMRRCLAANGFSEIQLERNPRFFTAQAVKKAL